MLLQFGRLRAMRGRHSEAKTVKADRRGYRGKRSLAVAGLAALMSCTLVSPSFAHHSFAMFDRQKEVVIKGTVKQLQWTNPHVFVQVMVTNQAGVEEEWSIESASPNMLFRQGWNPKVLHTGDKVSVTINPLRSGGRGGYFLFAELPDGKTLGQRTRGPGSGPPG